MSKPYLVTFTGADDRTDIAEMEAFAARWPQAEFAVLFLTARMGQPLYPTWDWLEAVADNEKIPNKSLHFCAEDVEALLIGANRGKLLRLAARYPRIQLNFRADRQPNITAELIDDLCWWLREISDTQVISSYNPMNHAVATKVREKNHLLLLDSSFGKGVLPASWPSHPPGFEGRCGSAGGLGPDTIQAAYPRIVEASRGYPFWMDMQKGVCPNNTFSLPHCEQVMVSVFQGA